jgi:hypothetical protein
VRRSGPAVPVSSFVGPRGSAVDPRPGHVHDLRGDDACRAAAVAEIGRAVIALERALPALELGGELMAGEFGETLRVVERLSRRLEWLHSIDHA